MKRFCAIILALVMVSSLIFSMPIPVSAESMYIRKIVSVVYDDSGSMSGDKWAYANYAMQAFCGMLNSEDQLFITYMSHSQAYNNYDPQQVDLSAGGIQASVDAIRNHPDSGSTPYGAVEVAYNKLKSVNDSNPNTQYWLVVITDGEFDECRYMNDKEKKQFLNENFNDYTSATMPNGSNAQVTFLGIGGVTAPDENEGKGIFTYSASNAKGIINAMSSMADKVSGRTRLQQSDIQKVDDYTIEVSSSIPLLNIAVFAQGSQAKITAASYRNESDIPISRKVSLSYPRYSDLVGGAFLLGDSQTVIGSGTYYITFDQKVNLSDLIILFEPALEMRMVITVNGVVVDDLDELNNVMEGDVVSVSCKIYEMGTDTEVDPDLMPPGTKFEITISEDGQVVEQVSGENMSLEDYILKHINTEVKASLLIDGFNPIDCVAKFTPSVYVPKVVYTLEPSFGGDVKHVKFDEIANNQDLTICFTVYADGVPLTDLNAVKAMNPTITVSPQGNGGDVTYTDDGKIVFTPTSASMTTTNDGSFEVEVTCTLDDGTTATQVYTVLIATYEVIPVSPSQSVKRTELYQNQVGVSFYITKDGVKLDKAAVEKHISVMLNQEYESLKTAVVVSPDGTITVTPYSTQQREMTFGKWLGNWAYYWGLEKADITVSLSHAFGSASGTIQVVKADLDYRLKYVWLPFILELLLLIAVVSYIIRYVTKPRFASNGAIYIGSISRNRGTPPTHGLELNVIPLGQYNKFKYLWNPFKPLQIPVGGYNVTAVAGNCIQVDAPFPWYADSVRPKSKQIIISCPMDVVNYCLEKDELEILEIRPTAVMDEQNNVVSQDDTVYYFADAEIEYVKIGANQMEVIESAVAFCYATTQN